MYYHIYGDWLIWKYFLLHLNGILTCKLQIIFLQDLNVLHTFILFLHGGSGEDEKKPLCVCF